jgi:hypothetical protein
MILILGIGVFSSFFFIFQKAMPGDTNAERYRMIFIQNEEKKGEGDPHMLQILKEMQKTLDGWLKSLNERIESEDVTRFEVRFLEILRNILEWVKEKIDARIESSERRKEKKGTFRETHQRDVSFFEMG